MKNKLRLTGLIFCFLFVLNACKKDKITPERDPLKQSSRDDLTKDSLFLYAKTLYLWNDALPTYEKFNPRSYTALPTMLDNLDAELFKISTYKINPLTGKSYEYNNEYPEETKYSFIEDLVASGKLSYQKSKVSGIDFSGNGNDLGYALQITGSERNYKIYFKYASPGSPAALAGLGRGDYINEINGRKIGGDYSLESRFIMSAVSEKTITIGGIKKNGAPYKVTLTEAKYKSSPILKDSVLVRGGKRIGYLAYARFTSDENSELPLKNVFSKFFAADVTDLVIDLRYNPGGYVSTAEQLMNLIVPSNLNGKKMFVETYNAGLQAGKVAILKNQPIRDQQGEIVNVNGKPGNYADNVSYDQGDNTTYFEKEGSVNKVYKVVFITTDATASASELVINSLRPYLDVKTVGSTSYGKPVGFFPVRIDKFDVYMSSFYTTNAEGNGDYFGGIDPDSQQDDDVEKDFGDPNERSLAAAISYITSGRFTQSSDNRKVEMNGGRTGAVIKRTLFEPSSFKGMIKIPKVD